MRPGWDPRSNEGKEYRYAFSVGASAREPLRRLYEWQLPARRGAPSWDAEAAAAAARALQGEHSYAAFANAPRGSERGKVVDPRCTLSRVALRRHGGGAGGAGRYSVELRGDRFLYKMARNAVGALVRVGAGELRLDELEAALRDGEWARSRSLPLTAPPQGLVLHRVFYPSGLDPFGGEEGEEDWEES